MSADRLRKDYSQIVKDLLDDLSSGTGGRAAFSDISPGSVVRTLVEAFARELAVAHAQLDQVYRLAYLDTADGPALDQVVALVGVVRRGTGHLEGTVTFSRTTPAPAAIAIPAGTRVAGRKQPLFETAAAATLSRGRTEVTVPVASVAPAASPVPAEHLNTLPEPLYGLEAVTNRDPLAPRTRSETDAQLRERTRRKLHSARTGTVTAVELAARDLGYQKVQVEEPPARPGVLEVIIGDDAYTDQDRDELRAALEHVRPAGIQLDLGGVTWIYLEVVAHLELARPLSVSLQKAVCAALEPRIRDYVSRLGARESVRDAKLRSLLAAHDDITTILELTVVPYLGKISDGVPDTGRLTTQHDILIGPRERAVAGIVSIVLEPPAPVVWLDVLFQPQSQAPVDVDRLRESLRQLIAANPPRRLEWTALRSALAPDLRASLGVLKFIAIHERDGLVAELARDGDSEPLDPREVIQLRNIQPEVRA